MVIRNIILDIDLTLVQCIPLSLGYELYLNNFTIYEYSRFYIVVLRPGLFDFLNYLFTNFRVIIWSNNSAEFVKFFCEKVLFKYDWIPYIIYTNTEYQDCLLQTGMHKDIEFLCEASNLQASETIIIDDSLSVALTNEKKCIQIEPFVVFSKNAKNCKNPAFFGPFETMYSKVENLILNTESKSDLHLYSVLDFLRSMQKEA